MVRLQSVNQAVSRELLNFTREDWTVQQMDKVSNKAIGPKIQVEGVSFAGLDLKKEWVVKVRLS